MEPWVYGALLAPVARPVFRYIIRGIAAALWYLPWSPKWRIALYRDDRW